MDRGETSDLSGRANNSVKWFSNQEDIKAKKYSYIWAKYSLEDKQNPANRTEFAEKIIYCYTKNTFSSMVLDETGFSLRVIRRKVGKVKGRK